MPQETTTPADGLEIIRPDARRDAEAVYDLTARAFPHQGYWNWLEYCRRRYFCSKNTYDWSASTIGLLDGRVVTHWGIWGYTMRIGRAKVRMAGVGAVATDETMRKQGLMTRTGHAAVQACRDAGYDLTILFGRGHFYELFGFVPAWPGLMYAAGTGALPTDPPALRARRFTGSSRPDVAAAYNRHNATRTGTAVRPTTVAPWHPGRYGLLWADKQRRTDGYVIIDPGGESLNVVDFAGDADQVLRVVAGQARQADAKEVHFIELHAADPLAVRLRREYCRETFTWSKSGGAMARCLNLRSLLTKMAAELSHRLRASDLADWKGQLLIADPREQVALRLAGGKVTVHPAVGAFPDAVRGGEEIVRLLIGADGPEEIVDAAGIRLTGHARRLLPVLFPNQHCRLSAWDHF